MVGISIKISQHLICCYLALGNIIPTAVGYFFPYLKLTLNLPVVVDCRDYVSSDQIIARRICAAVVFSLQPVAEGETVAGKVITAQIVSIAAPTAVGI